MYTLLVDPDRFFADSTQAYNLKAASLLVLIVAVVSLGGPLYVFSNAVLAFPVPSHGLLAVGGGVTFLGAFVGTYLTWLVYAGLMYLLSSVFTGAGDFRTVFAYSGWTFLPTLVFSSMVSIVVITSFWGVTFPADPTKFRPFIENVTANSFVPTLRSVRGLFTIWQGFLMVFAIKHARAISLRQAGFLSALLTVGALLGSLHLRW